MSGLVGAAVAALGGPLFQIGWQSRLLPASFRGVPFFVAGHELQGGRRGVLHEFPDRDIPVTEDLGRAAGRYSIEAFVIGDNYDQARDDLIDAVFNVAGPGTLVHPYLGTIEVQMMDGCSMREQAAPGGIANFRLVCVQAGDALAERSSIDTASSLLADALQAWRYVQAGYALYVQVKHRPAFLRQALLGGLASAGAALLGLPVGTLADVRATVAAMTATPDDPAATAAATAAAFRAAAAATLAAGASPADPSGGLAAIATWSGIDFPPTLATPDRVQEAVNAQALLDLIRAGAVLAAAEIYAQTEWASADAARAARAWLVAAIDARAAAATAAPDADSFAGWQALADSAATDLTDRAMRLPIVAPYSAPAPQPSLALAFRLYAEAGHAEALAALNGARHPLFMPPAGIWLEPV